MLKHPLLNGPLLNIDYYSTHPSIIKHPYSNIWANYITSQTCFRRLILVIILHLSKLESSEGEQGSVAIKLTIWIFNIAMERSTKLLRTVKHLFLWAIYTMANC